MIELNLNLLVTTSQTFIAALMVWALLSEAALSLPKWQRLLMSTGAAALFAQAAVIVSTSGGFGVGVADGTTYLKDLSIGVLALVPVAMLLDRRRIPIAHTSRTSLPSDRHPNV